MFKLTVSLKKANLVPSAATALIPTSFAPTADLSVSFGDSVPVQLGNLLHVSQAGAGAADASYLVMLIDPDAPTPEDPKFAFWRHWVVSGLKSASSSSVTRGGATLTAFLGPGPKTRVHPTPTGTSSCCTANPPGLALCSADVGRAAFVERRSFDAAGFVAAHGLQLAGVNWMMCAADEWSASSPS